MYSRRTCFIPCWSFVTFGIWRNVWGCARDWNKSSRKGRTGKKIVYKHPCCVYWVMCLWKSKCKRMCYWKSRVYIASPCHVVGSEHTIYFARDKIKGVDVVNYHRIQVLNYNKYSSKFTNSCERICNFWTKRLYPLCHVPSGTHGKFDMKLQKKVEGCIDRNIVSIKMNMKSPNIRSDKVRLFFSVVDRSVISIQWNLRWSILL